MVDPQPAPPARQAAPSPGTQTRPNSLWLGARMVFYFVFFLGFVLVLLPYAAHQLHQIPGWPTVELGLAGQIVGAILWLVFFVWYTVCSIWLSAAGKGAYVEFDPPKEFVETGPYRWVRNPVAAGVVAMIGAEAVFFSSTGVFALFLAAGILAHLQVVRLEEPLLAKRFGQSYTEYCQRVPRWIPRRPRTPGR